MQKGADPLDAARARLEREYLSGLESSPSDQRAERVIPDALTCSISLGKAIAEATGAHCRSDDVVRELLRGARQHLTKFVPELQNNLLEQAQVGLGHAFSRCKVKAPS